MSISNSQKCPGDVISQNQKQKLWGQIQALFSTKQDEMLWILKHQDLKEQVSQQFSQLIKSLKHQVVSLVGKLVFSLNKVEKANFETKLQTEAQNQRIQQMFQTKQVQLQLLKKDFAKLQSIVRNYEKKLAYIHTHNPQKNISKFQIQDNSNVPKIQTSLRNLKIYSQTVEEYYSCQQLNNKWSGFQNGNVHSGIQDSQHLQMNKANQEIHIFKERQNLWNNSSNINSKSIRSRDSSKQLQTSRCSQKDFQSSRIVYEKEKNNIQNKKNQPPVYKRKIAENLTKQSIKKQEKKNSDKKVVNKKRDKSKQIFKKGKPNSAKYSQGR